MPLHRLALAMLFLLLAGCDQVNGLLGLEDLAKKEERLEADGRAVGGGCRQSGRAIEDCYAIYSWLPRAAVYAGWRDMDAYMRENNIETVVPQLPPVEPPGARKRRSVENSEETEEPSTDKPSKVPPTKTDVKHEADTAKTAGKAPAAEDKKITVEKSSKNSTTKPESDKAPEKKTTEKAPPVEEKKAPAAPPKSAT